MQKIMSKPKGYILVHNISKKNNIGNIVRSACAFNMSRTFYVSNKPQTSRKMKAMKDFQFFGNQGTLKHMQFQGFHSLIQAKKFFIQNKIRVCGVQIGENSHPIHEHKFQGDTVFFLGNEGTGLIPVHRQICDQFVYIPQYTDKTASLNVSVAAGIIFHYWALFAGYQQSKVYGEKYQLQSQNKSEIQSVQLEENVKKQKNENQLQLLTKQLSQNHLQQKIQQQKQ